MKSPCKNCPDLVIKRQTRNDVIICAKTCKKLHDFQRFLNGYTIYISAVDIADEEGYSIYIEE